MGLSARVGTPRVLPGRPGWSLARVCLAGLLALAVWPAGAGAQFNGEFGIERFRLTEENFLDFKAYQPPYTWRYDWYRAANGMQASVGSLSMKRFYLFDEIRLQKQVGPVFTFLYRQREDALFRPDPLYQEVEFRLGRQLFASVIGFPDHVKERDQMGLAVGRGRPNDWDYLRLSRLNQFIQYNGEHAGNERFDPEPVTDRVELRQLWAGSLLVAADLRQEYKTVLNDPDAGLRYTYQGQKVDLRLDWKQEEAWLVGANYNGNRERREHLTLAPGNAALSQEQTLEWGWLDVYGALHLQGGSLVQFGVFSGVLDNRIGAAEPASAYSTRLSTDLGYAYWQRPHGTAFQWLFSLLVGHAHFQERVGGSPFPPRDEWSWQYKWGVGIVLEEPGSYRFFFNSTWDPDVTERAWDGGNVQLQMFF